MSHPVLPADLHPTGSPTNEPVRSYAPGTSERSHLKARLGSMAHERVEIPLVVGGTRLRGQTVTPVVMPCEHAHVLADWHGADASQVTGAIDAARRAAPGWASWPLAERAAVFTRAADLLAGEWRDTVNAATMLGQGKTAFQAEIDAACELIDFWRFNVAFAAELHAEQPISTPGVTNVMDYRPLEGFVYAVTPFNFTAIAGNVSTANVIMGGVTIWKPAASAMLSAYYVLQLLEAAGLPPGVINFVPGDPVAVSEVALSSPDLAGIHFTGSTTVFQSLWRTVGSNLDRYRTYPRLVGETGGKDFVVIHRSADLQAAAVAIVRGGFEYQGQKCSAASRVYVPASCWPELRERVVEMMRQLRMGDVRDFRNFLGAVIDGKAFHRISGYLDLARQTATVVAGGRADDRVGFFIEPTLVHTTDPAHRLMTEEIFGPVVTVHAYEDDAWPGVLDLVDRTSPYALTGAVFAEDPDAIREAASRLRQAAGNFYVNDKPTGAVVGQQPFGGARASGTNDKAGSKLNLTRWVSARTIKQTSDPPHDFRYPFMDEA